MPKLTRRTLLQAATVATAPGLARRAGASLVTVSWDRPRAAPGDAVRVIVRGPVEGVRITLHPPKGPPTEHELRLRDGRGEMDWIVPIPDRAGAHVWRAEVAGASAPLQIIANRFAFGL